MVKGSRSGGRWIEGLAGKDRVERSQEGLALLAQGRQIAADRRVGIRPSVTAETARDLLLPLEPAQIAFGLVVVEGDGEVVEERKHLVLPEQEAFQRVAC